MIEKIPNDICLISMLVTVFLLGILTSFLVRKFRGSNKTTIQKLIKYNNKKGNKKEFEKIRSLYDFVEITNSKSQNK